MLTLLGRWCPVQRACAFAELLHKAKTHGHHSATCTCMNRLFLFCLSFFLLFFVALLCCALAAASARSCSNQRPDCQKRRSREGVSADLPTQRSYACWTFSETQHCAGGQKDREVSGSSELTQAGQTHVSGGLQTRWENVSYKLPERPQQSASLRE